MAEMLRMTEIPGMYAMPRMSNVSEMTVMSCIPRMHVMP